jgi:hypothetical protein
VPGELDHPNLANVVLVQEVGKVRPRWQVSEFEIDHRDDTGFGCSGDHSPGFIGVHSERFLAENMDATLYGLKRHPAVEAGGRRNADQVGLFLVEHFFEVRVGRGYAVLAGDQFCTLGPTAG